MNSRQHKYLDQAFEWRFEIGFLAVVLLAGVLRLWQLGSIPPGLDGGEAALALRALEVSAHPSVLLHSFGGGLGSWLFIAGEALIIRLFGTTISAARILSAFGGIAGVLAIYGLTTSWFGRRAGLIAGLLAAVTPWFITLSRINTPVAFAPLGVALALWAGTQAVRDNNWRLTVLAAVAGGLTMEVRGAWIFGLMAVVLFAHQALRPEFRRKHIKQVYIGLIVFLAVLVPLAIHTIATAHPSRLVLNHPTQQLLHGINATSDTALMLVWHGDTNFRYNLSGVPLFNLFVALMLLAGVLVSASKSRNARYRTVLIMFVLSIIVTALTSVDAPSAFGSYLVAPLAVILAAIGVEYMLHIWYSTFPINAAARTLGTLPIMVLLAITAFQGYKQYFYAWADSPEVYEAYNESARGLSEFLIRADFSGQRYVITSSEDANIIAYLTYKQATYSLLKTDELAALPQTELPRQFLFVTAPNDNTLQQLKTLYPKARLSQHYSAFNDANELFAVYETNHE